MKASRRPSSFSATNGVPKMETELDGLPREAQLPQAPPVVFCQMCQSAPSELVREASRRPSSFFRTKGSDNQFAADGLPREAQLLHFPLGVFCQICQSAPATLPSPAPERDVTVTKISRRPSSFFLRKGEERPMLPPVGVPEENQLPQPPPGVVCQMCQSALSLPVAKASRRPSSFTCTPIRGLNATFAGLVREVQLLQPPVASCQMCKSSPLKLVVKTSWRPSSFAAIAGLLSNTKPYEELPKEDQPSQPPPPLGACCRMCISSTTPSTPLFQMNASKRPSAFLPTEGPAAKFPVVPSEVQLLITILSPF